MIPSIVKQPLLKPAEEVIQRDYHPVPQQNSDPDQMVAPLVLPASLSQTRFDPSNPIQSTYLDSRGRMQSRLVRVAAFDFANYFGLSNPNNASLSTPALLDTKVSGMQQIHELPLVTLQMAYVECECTMQLAESLAVTEEQTALVGTLAFATPTATTAPTTITTECPRNLIWCCAYTPPGIQNGYWQVESILCQYNMFVLSLQAAFLQHHTNRCSRFLIDKDDERRQLYNKAYVRVCQRHLDYLSKRRHEGSPMVQQAYVALTTLGMLPNEATLRCYKDIIELMQLDYRIFHMLLPIFADNSIVCLRAVKEVLIPTEIVTVESTASIKSVDYIRKLIAFVEVALKKARNTYKNVFIHNEHETDTGTRDYYRDTLVLKHMHLIQIVKYLVQAPYVYKTLYWSLMFNLAVREPTHNRSMGYCVKMLRGFAQDPCFRLFLYNGNQNHAIAKIAQQMSDIQNERQQTQGYRPSPYQLSTNAIVASELQRTNTAFPTEVYQVDLLYEVWATKLVAQYPPALLDTIAHVISKLDAFIVKNSLVDGEAASLNNVTLTDAKVVAELKTILIKEESLPYTPSGLARDYCGKVIRQYKHYLQQQQREIKETLEGDAASTSSD